MPGLRHDPQAMTDDPWIRQAKHIERRELGIEWDRARRGNCNANALVMREVAAERATDPGPIGRRMGHVCSEIIDRFDSKPMARSRVSV